MTTPIATEHAEQVAFVKWIRAQHPKLLVFSVPNGAHLAGNGWQRAVKIKKLKAEGMLPGAPDLIIPAWRIAIEFKRTKRSAGVSDEQSAVHDALRACGWAVIVAYGFTDAMAQLGQIIREIDA